MIIRHQATYKDGSECGSVSFDNDIYVVGKPKGFKDSYILVEKSAIDDFLKTRTCDYEFNDLSIDYILNILKSNFDKNKKILNICLDKYDKQSRDYHCVLRPYDITYKELCIIDNGKIYDIV